MAVVLAAALIGQAPARAAGGSREEARREARQDVAAELFAKGKYQDAIDIYAGLFAETKFARYQFNIGHCYQNMGDPDRAITNFRDYLRKGDNISPKDRVRAEAAIKEMEELKRQRESARSASASVGAEPPARVESAPAPAPPRRGPDGAGTSVPVAPAPPTAATSPAASPDAALAAFRARQHDEAAWVANAKPADEARITSTEKLLASAKADDPRLGEYRLFLGKLYAGKHFDLKLRARRAQNKLVKSKDDTSAAAEDEARAINAEASRAFLKAVENYAAAARVRGFAKTDEALFRLGVILEANDLGDRSRGVLGKLIHDYPDSRWRKEVLGAPPGDG